MDSSGAPPLSSIETQDENSMKVPKVITSN
jgi:hypothetical protein